MDAGRYQEELQACEAKRATVQARAATFADDLVALQEEARLLKSCYDVAKAEQTSEAIAQTDAEELAKRQGGAAEAMAKRHAEMSAIMGLTTLAAQCRVKPADERSTEERNFVAQDVLLHPELCVGRVWPFASCSAGRPFGRSSLRRSS